MKTTITAFLSILTGIALGGEVTFGWFPNPPEDNVSGYRIHWGTESGTYTESSDLGLPEQTQEGDGGLILVSAPVEIPAGDWFAALTAYNDAGQSGYSNEIAFNVPMAPPSSPTGFIEITVQASTDLQSWSPVDTIYREEQDEREFFRLAYRRVEHPLTYLKP